MNELITKSFGLISPRILPNLQEDAYYSPSQFRTLRLADSRTILGHKVV